MIFDDIWWYFDDIWWYLMIFNDILMIFDDICVFDDILMIFSGIWWYLMIFDGDIWEVYIWGPGGSILGSILGSLFWRPITIEIPVELGPENGGQKVGSKHGGQTRAPRPLRSAGNVLLTTSISLALNTDDLGRWILHTKYAIRRSRPSKYTPRRGAYSLVYTYYIWLNSWEPYFGALACVIGNQVSIRHLIRQCHRYFR